MLPPAFQRETPLLLAPDCSCFGDPGCHIPYTSLFLKGFFCQAFTRIAGISLGDARCCTPYSIGDAEVGHRQHCRRRLRAVGACHPPIASGRCRSADGRPSLVGARPRARPLSPPWPSAGAAAVPPHSQPREAHDVRAYEYQPF